MEKKNQHVIPRCYLQAWCDPSSPERYEPYVWRHSKDGKSSKRIAPKNTFVESEFYTIHLKDGTRDLVIEDSFQVIEDKCSKILRTKIAASVPLTAEERGLLCYFTAMMTTRTKSQREHWNSTFGKIHQNIVDLEKYHNAEPSASSVSQNYAEYGHHLTIGSVIETVVTGLFRMELVIFVAVGESRFVTSDHPCVWFNPEAYKWPPLMRGVGIAQEKIEITLPLSPTHLALFAWQIPTPRRMSEETWKELGGYLPVPDGVVNEMNRRTVGHCTSEFITHDGKTLEMWFDPGQEPADSWEKQNLKTATQTV